jgi:hypothetical protein
MIRPLKPKAKTILKIGAVFAVIAFILFLWTNARPVPAHVQITFTGFTKTAVRLGSFGWPPTNAYFCVSNAGKCSVDNKYFRYETKNHEWGSLTNFGGQLTGELKPGEFKTIKFLVPETTEPWRVSLSFSKIDWRYKLLRKTPPPLVVGMIKEFVPASWLERGSTWEFYSDWVDRRPDPVKYVPLPE